MFRHVTPLGRIVMIAIGLAFLMMLLVPCSGIFVLVTVCAMHFLYDNRKAILKILGM